MEGIIEKIDKALEGIRPYLANDGGNVKVVEVTEDMIARVEFLGACSTCRLSPMTFKAGVEDAIMKAVPEIRKIEAINLTLS